jgi:hypothetical protein
MTITFYIRDHQGKSKAYRMAMIVAGFKEISSHTAKPRFAFFDSDVTKFRKKRIDDLTQETNAFIYPHTARPPLFYDFRDFKPHPKTKAIFVMANGHKEVLERIGYSLPIYVTGWTFSPVLPFHVSPSIKRITFAPIHANANLWNAPINRDINQRVMGRLVKLKQKRPEIEVTIRYIRSLDTCGLHPISGFSYVHGQPDQSVTEIKNADLIIATETYAYLSIAMGKPTLQMAEFVPPRIGNSPENFGYVNSWDKYKNLMEYPLDALDQEKTLWDVIGLANHKRDDVELWKERMIGKSFVPKEFIKILLRYAG